MFFFLKKYKSRYIYGLVASSQVVGFEAGSGLVTLGIARAKT